MPGYRTLQARVPIAGAAALIVRALVDRQQFDDPHGHAERLGISSAAWPLFGLPWPSGLRLAARIAARAVRPGERILEIGCGLALPSLVGHRMGADVTASDCHPLAAGFLRRNLRLNGLGPMKYRHGRWGSPLRTGTPAPAREDRRGNASYDLIIGSDLLYERDAGGTLPAFIAARAAPGAEVWIVDPDRGNRAAFVRQMLGCGFDAREERLDTPADADAPAYKGRVLIYRRD